MSAAAGLALRLPRSVVLPALDPLILAPALALLVIGFIAITSASVEYAAVNYGNSFHHGGRHLVYMLVALSAGTLVWMLPTRFWFDTGWLWLFAGLALLALVLIPGIGLKVNGGRRWLALGPMTLQASEFAKLFLVIYLAGYLQRRELQVRSEWRGFVKPMAVVFI